MFLRALWTFVLLAAPLEALAGPSCTLETPHAAVANAPARESVVEREPAAAKHECCAGTSRTAGAKSRRACARVMRTSAAVAGAPGVVAAPAVVATRVAPPVAPKRAPEPVRREASPRIGPLFLSHQALLL